jgi:outer membrane protein
MKRSIKSNLLLLTLFLSGFSRAAVAQAGPGYSLQQLLDSAKKNNHLLKVRHYQLQEKMSRLKENEIKRYPLATLDGTFQYNFRLPQISIPAGTIGSVTTNAGGTQLLPSEASRFTVGSKSTFNVGLNVYQPLTQQFKISTGLAIDRVDIKLGQKEKEKMALQLQLAIEQLYYGALIAKKQTEAARTKLDFAKARLYDAEGALTAGKSTGVNLAGLRADIAGQEQGLLRLDMQAQDYLGELGRLANLDVSALEPPQQEPDNTPLAEMDAYKSAGINNPDMKIAVLNKEKALLGVKSANQSNLPDLGLVAGYYVQQGSPLLPGNSPYVGISLKWNIQDLFSNPQVKSQRQLQLRQAEETMAYTRQQLSNDIDKAWRKVKQSGALITAAQKLVGYRQDALREQLDRQATGMDIKTAMLETRSQLAEAEADLYAAQLSNVLAKAELTSLTGQP